jgi:outer membrane protein OmpA-like peptidoglycan-associated protein
MHKQVFNCFIAFTLLFTNNILGQKAGVIKLDNPSFEDYPQAGHTPQGWFDCGFASETPPDVQPNAVFKVTKTAMHGSTYLGMVTRDNNTWEAIGQRLKTPLVKGTNYNFSIYAARSEIYLSQSRTTNKDANYTTPIILRIWGGSGFCAKNEMLDETEPISSGTWQKMSFNFTPKSNHTHFMIEVFYKVPTLFPYNGNLLLDNASDITPKEEEKPIAAVKNVTAAKPTPKPPITKPTQKTTKDTPSVASTLKPSNEPDKSSVKTKPEIEVENPALSNSKLKEGQILKIEKLQFGNQSALIDKESYPQLDEVYQFLNANPNLVVEIGGHTNLIIEETMSIKLSLDRAKAVAEYLINKGIERKRLVTRGYGKSMPLVKETSQAANKVNQRVEIKILSISG